MLLGLCLAGLRVWCGGMEVWLSPSGGVMYREAGRLVLHLAGRALRVEFCIGKWGHWVFGGILPPMPFWWGFVLENALAGLASGRALQVGLCIAKRTGWGGG